MSTYGGEKTEGVKRITTLPFTAMEDGRYYLNEESFHLNKGTTIGLNGVPVSDPLMGAALTSPEWFDVAARVNFERFLLPYKSQRTAQCLQIGAYAGQASEWILENLPNAVLIDIDPWNAEMSEDLSHADFDAVLQAYTERTLRFGRRCLPHRMTSNEWFQRQSADLRPGLHLH